MVPAPQALIPGSGTSRSPFGEEDQPFPLLGSSSPEPDADTATGANGTARTSFQSRAAAASPWSQPLTGRTQKSCPIRPASSPDIADLQRLEDAVADCTEAIHLAPDDPRLYLERDDADTGLRGYEEPSPTTTRRSASSPPTSRAIWAAPVPCPIWGSTRQPSRTTRRWPGSVPTPPRLPRTAEPAGPRARQLAARTPGLPREEAPTPVHVRCRRGRSGGHYARGSEVRCSPLCRVLSSS